MRLRVVSSKLERRDINVKKQKVSEAPARPHIPCGEHYSCLEYTPHSQLYIFTFPSLPWIRACSIRCTNMSLVNRHYLKTYSYIA